MRALIQRVQEANVKVDAETVGEIGPGILVFLGVKKGDDEAAVDFLVDKIINLRIFPNEEGKFDKSVKDINGSLLVVSQFTLYGNCQKGRRPDFLEAASPDLANSMYEKFVEKLKTENLTVQTGVFQAKMDVSLVNDGPVTLMLESK